MRAALAFLTPLPVGARPPDARTLAWFPVAGALIGLVLGALWWAIDDTWPPLIVAGLVVLADVVLTGALHLDGLADSADGLLPHLEGPDRRRAVMAAPDVGAYGIVAVVVTLGLRWACLASITPDVWLLAATWCMSRAVMAVALARGPYVGGGLGTAFTGASATACAAIGGALSFGLASLDIPRTAAVSAAAVAGAAVVAAGRRRLGGVTGDVLGAAGVVAETVALVVASASW